MEKSGLETGMVVTQRDGRKGQVMLGAKRGDGIHYLGCWFGYNGLTYWNDDLTSNFHRDQDIMEVERPKRITKPCGECSSLWTRPASSPTYTVMRSDGKFVTLSVESANRLEELFEGAS